MAHARDGSLILSDIRAPALAIWDFVDSAFGCYGHAFGHVA
jgi:hypothetical protein